MHSSTIGAGLLTVLLTGLFAGACATSAPAPPPAGPASVSAPLAVASAPAAALIEAADRGDAAAVRTLLGQGAPVDARDDEGATALVRAAYGNHLEVAGLLLAAHADVDLTDNSQQSAYLIATSEVGDDPRLLELTLNAGADINAKDSYNGTGLIRAAERAHVTIVERLLRAGIDRDHVNRLGYTALHEAVVFGEGGPADQDTVAALVTGGVAVNIPDGRGVTALAHAERSGQHEVATILRTAGATR